MSDTNSVLKLLVGLTLDEARDTLKSDAQMGAMPIRIVQTTPPARPARRNGKGDRHPPQWGAWRVLRCRLVESASAAADMRGGIELLVAREELRRQEVAGHQEVTGQVAPAPFSPPV